MTVQNKPHDVGNGLVCASFGSGGEWLSLATVDEDVGFVELTGLPLFDPELRGNPDAVRRYRSWMRREEHGFLHFEAVRASVSTRQDAPRGTRGLVQRLVFTALPADRPAGVRIRFSGRVARPALAEVSEVDPPEFEDVPTRMHATEGTLQVQGEGGPVIVQAWLRQGGPGSTGGRADSRIGWKLMDRRMPTAVAWADWPPDAEELHLDIACTFDQPAPPAPDWLTEGSVSPSDGGREGDRPLQVPTRLVNRLGA